jgi:hypothetical protein
LIFFSVAKSGIKAVGISINFRPNYRNTVDGLTQAMQCSQVIVSEKAASDHEK